MAGGHMPSSREHWEKVYMERKPDEVSWFQQNPEKSLALITNAQLSLSARIIDVGGGASRLVDRLAEIGYKDLSVLDISEKALEYAKVRHGDKEPKIEWIQADATTFQTSRTFDVWHDRAVFHFLTDPAERFRYRLGLKRALRAGGNLIIATFAPDGPEKCSGLSVCRYGKDNIVAELGSDFELLETAEETHRTPWDTTQHFNYFRFRKMN
jgi:SAM-dependent methyltransferase